MTSTVVSEFGQTECFVYIMLPGTSEFVTAGRFVLDPTAARGPVGRFVYGQSYLARKDAVAIDPVELKLGKGTFRTAALKGVFGALRDAGPDYWGRRVIEKHSGAGQLGELDYLLYAPDDRAGALGFGLNQKPPAPKRQFNQTLALEKLQGLADRIIADEEIPDGAGAEQVQDLMLAGTSMGGARPKAVVEDDDGLWIAKFTRPDDNWNHARIEHAMLTLARDCGLHTAESRLATVGGRDVLLVKRFDRQKTDQGYLRARMVSGLTLLRTETRISTATAGPMSCLPKSCAASVTTRAATHRSYSGAYASTPSSRIRMTIRATMPPLPWERTGDCHRPMT